MAKPKSMKKLKHAVQALQRSLSFSGRRAAPGDPLPEGDFDVVVPEDVKEGHFAVLAISGDKTERFVVPLRCLSHPVFLRLLELAEEEFGFRQAGTLALPCRPSEFKKIIGEL